MFESSSLVESAVRVAIIAHSGQVRKSDASPYVVHPLMCAFKLQAHNFSEVVIAAALVHDVLEDTEMNPEELQEVLGESVVDIVTQVTEDKSLVWEKRKERYVQSVRKGPEEVKAVSVVDKIHNLECTLFEYNIYGEAFWEKFSRGKVKKLWFEESCLEMFKETWKHPLIAEYEILVEKMRQL